MKAFVTGSTGGIGTALCERLSRDGWEVVALVRLQSDATYVSSLPRVELATAGILDEGALEAAMRGSDVVFHLAAVVHAPPDEPEMSFHRTNVDGTRAVVNAAVAAGVTSLVFFSTVAVYPETDDMLDEDSAVGPSTAYGATKLAGEAIVLEQRTRMRVTVLRLPVVYGVRDRGNVRRLIEAVATGRFVIPGKGENIKTMVAADNVIDAAIACATNPAAAGQVYVVTDERASTLREIVTTIAHEAGVAVPRSLSLPLMSALGSIVDAMRKVVSLPVTADQVRKLASSTRYSGDRIRRDLNLRPRVGLKDGIREAVRGYREGKG